MKDTQPTIDQVNSSVKMGLAQLQRELKIVGIDCDLTMQGQDLIITGWHNPDVSTDQAIIGMLGLYFHVDVSAHAIPNYGGRGWLWTDYNRRLIVQGTLRDAILARIDEYSHIHLLRIVQDSNMKEELDGLYNADGTRNYAYYAWHQIYSEDRKSVV